MERRRKRSGDGYERLTSRSRTSRRQWGTARRPVQKRYTFQIPSARLADLRALHLSAVSLGNNHAGDFGEEGLAGTQAALDARGVGHFGAGEDLNAASPPGTSTFKGVTVAFVAVSLADPAGDREPRRPPPPRARAGGGTRGSRSPCALRDRAGTLGRGRGPLRSPTSSAGGRWFVEHGASAVVGSGPHEVRADETIAGAPVYYSLGNLWFRGRWPKASRTAGIAFLGLDDAGRVVANRLERVAPSTLQAARAHQR